MTSVYSSAIVELEKNNAICANRNLRAQAKAPKAIEITERFFSCFRILWVFHSVTGVRAVASFSIWPLHGETEPKEPMCCTNDVLVSSAHSVCTFYTMAEHTGTRTVHIEGGFQLMVKHEVGCDGIPNEYPGCCIAKQGRWRSTSCWAAQCSIQRKFACVFSATVQLSLLILFPSRWPGPSQHAYLLYLCSVPKKRRNFLGGSVM